MAHRICPVWVGFLLANPLRRLLTRPESLLAPYVKPGMTVVEVGPAMGFFSIPMAQMVGSNGRLVTVDVQEGMLKRLRTRAAKVGVADRIDARLCPPDSLGVGDLNGKADFGFLFAVAHEVPDQRKLFADLAAALKPGAKLLFAEPAGHVKEEEFGASLALAQQSGLKVVDRLRIRGSVAALLRKE